MSIKKTEYFKFGDTLYEVIPPAPTEIDRGGIIAVQKESTDTVEAKLGSDGKLYVPEYPDLTNYYNQDEVDLKIDETFNFHTSNPDIHFTATERTKLSGIAAGAQVNTITGVKGSSESSYRTGNINITKANIGLGNVDNTSDANKPVSTAQQTAIDTTLTSAKSYTDTKTSGLASTSSVNTNISNHNTSTSAHNDIRGLITDLTTKLNNFLDVDNTTTDQLSEVIELINNNKGTLDSLTTNKINVSDVVNNLTTNSTGKVLSAAQGVAIKSLIDALDSELDGKATSGHTHSNMVVKLNGGSTEGTNLFTYNGGSAKTINITPSSIGAQAAGSYASSSHTHDDRYYTESEIDTKVSTLNTAINGKADSSHTHSISNITNLQSTLDGKASSSHTHSASEITAGTLNGSLTIGSGKVIDFVTKAGKFRILGGGSTDTASIRLVDNGNNVIEDILQVNVNTGEITGGNLKTALDGKAASSHTHPASFGITTSGTGAAYTATVDGITSLTAGVSFIMIPNTVSTSTAPTLNVNSLGAKTIRRRTSNATTSTSAGYAAAWLAANKPITVTYDGTYWIADLPKPMAADMSGTLGVANGGTGKNSVTANSFLVGNGTSAMTEKTPETWTFTLADGSTVTKKVCVW